MSVPSADYQRLIFRLEKYFDSIERVNALPQEPEEWQQYIGALESRNRETESSRLAPESKELSDIPEEPDLSSLKTSDSHAEVKKDSTVLKTLRQDEEDCPGASSGKELPVPSTSKSFKRKSDAKISFKALPRKVKKTKPRDNSSDETFKSIGMADKKLLTAQQYDREALHSPSKVETVNHWQTCLKDDDIHSQDFANVLQESLSIQPHVILKKFVEKLIDNNADTSNLLPRCAIKSVVKSLNSETTKVERKEKALKDIQHLAQSECKKCTDPVSLQFWSDSKFDMGFTPPGKCPDALFCTKSQSQEYSELVKRIKQRKLRVTELSSELQRRNELKSLTDNITQAFAGCLGDMSSSQKLVVSEKCKILKDDLEELLDRNPKQRAK